MEEEGARVVEAFPGGPAEAAGVRFGEIIAAIDGRPAAGISLEEAAGALRGLPGSDVRLRVRRPGSRREVALRRDARYRPFADFPEGVRTVSAPAPPAPAARPVADPAGCLLVIGAEGLCHYSCRSPSK
jgi:hypothetical protein